MPRKNRKTPESHKLKRSKWSSKLFPFKILALLVLVILSLSLIWIKTQNHFCANSISCIKDLSGKTSSENTGIFMGKSVNAPNPSYFAQKQKNSNVLGTSDILGNKHIYVNLSSQHLYAYQGGTLLYDFPISSGKWNLTPVGNFYIWVKLVATRMTGGKGSDYYNLPNVPWTMFFYNSKTGKSKGFSLHGAYWHNNFGHPMSHGCINISPDNAKLLFDWANPLTDGYSTPTSTDNPGTLVTIYGVTPNQDLIGTRFYNNNVSPDGGN